MKLDRNKYLESRSLRPRDLLLGILGVNLLLGVIVLAFPKGVINLWASNKIKFVSASELLASDTITSTVDLTDVLKGVEPIANLEKPLRESVVGVKNDTLVAKISTEIKSSANYDVEEEKLDPPKQRSLQLPPNNPKALQSLMNALVYESKSKVVRILHYGDSQLEGDRITDYLRNRMQLLFGGSGPGILLPNEPAANARRSAYVTQSKNYVKKAIYTKGKYARGNRYGIGASSFYINGNTSKYNGMDTVIIKGDSISADRTSILPNFTGSNTTNFIDVKISPLGFPLTREFSNFKLLYNSSEPFQVKVKTEDVDTTDLVKSYGFGVKKIQINPSKKVKFSIVNGAYPELFGVALDGETGVAVDNFAMRGSSAIGYHTMNRKIYAQQLKQLNVRCIIFQYGINVVPNVRKDYSYYTKMLVKELRSIKRAYPGISIIVVGPSDMSRNLNGQKVSYPNIALINREMQNAAFETGCAFWDLYSAMGGKNSMPQWVSKGLAQKDYTHFSYNGAKYVGEMLFEAILEQVQNQGYLN